MTKTSAPLPTPPETALEPLLRALLAEHADGQSYGVKAGVPWIKVAPTPDDAPAQGWKLHISAREESARAILALTVPVLARLGATFKIAATTQVLRALNSGAAGPTQIGKFLTVYPRDDAHAVALAAHLDEATRSFAALNPLPRVPSDQALSPEGAVHYRFGGFGGRENGMLRSPLGEISFPLRAPDGTLEADIRRPGHYAPAWAVDPFRAADMVRDAPPPQPLIAERFALTRALHSSPRGAVFLALDTQSGRVCVVKQARRAAGGAEDSFERLRREERILRRLQTPAPDARFPDPIALVEAENGLFLAMADVPGVPLGAILGRASLTGQLPDAAQLLGWGQDIADIMAALHERDLIYRDLKADNLLQLRDGKLRLIDFETTFDRHDDAPPLAIGTRGHCSPQQESGAAPAFSDDIFALGALLYGLCIGSDASRAPVAGDLLNRPLALLNRAIPVALGDLIARCLDANPANRPQSATEISAMFAQMRADLERDALPIAPVQLPSLDEQRAHYRARAMQLGASIVSEAQPAPDGENLHWISRQPAAMGDLARDLALGGAGPVLALAELCGAAPDNSDWRDALRRGARWLASAPPLPFAPLPGLYIGEAGIGAAMLRAAQILDDADLRATAARRSLEIRGLDSGSPDLFNGLAGRLRFHLLAWDETGDDAHLQAAREAGEALIASAEPTNGEGLAWRFPANFGSLSGQRLPGYAHGAAGIADALLDLFEATGEARFGEAAVAAARWIGSLKMPCLRDNGGLAWPHHESEGESDGRSPGAMPTPPFWCHGAAGIARFFLHLWQLDVYPDAESIARGAAASVAQIARFNGPTQCHGLAGNLEIMLDFGQATGEAPWFEAANEMGQLLEAWGREQEGQWRTSCDAPDMFSPDYLTGYAGTAVALLRLSEPHARPHQLSRAGFRWASG